MRIFHRNCLYRKAMFLSEFSNFIRVIVGHQETPLQGCGNAKKLFMVSLNNYRVCFLPFSGGGIWRVNEECGALVSGMLAHYI